MITYNSESTIVKTKAPRVEFTHNVPSWFIEKFLNYMAKNYIKVKDYQGNELKVYYDYGDMR